MLKVEKLYNEIQELVKEDIDLIVKYKPLGWGGMMGLNVIDINTSNELSVICGPNTYSDEDTFEIWDDLFIPKNDVEGHMTQEDIIKRIKGEDNVLKKKLNTEEIKIKNLIQLRELGKSRKGE